MQKNRLKTDRTYLSKGWYWRCVEIGLWFIQIR